MKNAFMWLIPVLSLTPVGALFAGDIYKAANTELLTNTASWVGGAVPSASDVAVWDATLTGANSVTLGGALTWDGIRIANPGGAVTINGTDRLTLDGGAPTDIDMSVATKDLTLNTPVTLSGAPVLTVNAGRTLTLNGAVLIGTQTINGDGRLVFGGAVNNSGSGTYAAGQTVFGSSAVLNGDTKLTGGTVFLRGTTTILGGGTETLAIYNGALILDGGALTMTNTASSRFFVGRTDATSDGLMIVSNGTHAVLGANGDSMANFIGVSGAKRGRLFMEGGRLTTVFLRLATNQKASSGDLTDELRVNGGVLSVTDSGNTSFLMGTSHANTTAEASRSGLLEVAGGRFEIPNGTTWISTDGGLSNPQTLDVRLSGGTLAVQKITVGSKPEAVKRFWFNGGILQATNAVTDAELIDGSDVNATFSIQSRGLLLDSGSGSVRFSKNLVEDPASTGGGLVKCGTGMLTLAGANTYTGPTIVSNGLFRLVGTLAVTNLTVVPGAGLSMADGELTRFAPAALSLGSVAQASRLEFEVAASGSDCDRLVLPAGVWIQKTEVALFQQGTRNPVARVGDFPILSYMGSAPSAGWLSWGTPVKGFTCSFERDSATRIVYARIRLDGSIGVSVWSNPGSGAWATASNWSVMPSSAAAVQVAFAEIPTAPSTVTLDTPFTVGQMVFSNANAYTLSGAGSLTLDNGASSSAIAVDKGAHTVSLPLNSASSMTISSAANASLTVDGVIAGTGALLKQGSGDLILTAANTYAGGTTIQGGILALQSGASVGTGPISLAVNGGRLRSAGTDLVTVTNPVVIAASGGVLDAIAPMLLTGTLDWAAGQWVLNKYGTGELKFKGSANENGSYQINHRTGTFRVVEGASLVINSTARDTIYMSDTTTQPRTFVVETGAVVVAGGIYTGSGPSNTVYVNGGSLTFNGSSGEGESGLIRTVTDVAGTDRIIVDAGTLTFSVDDWLSTGVRGGGAEIIVNGGTATFGRLSLGVRADTGFSSSGLYTSAKVWVNGGLMDVAGAFNWMGDAIAGRTNQVYLNGGTLRLPATLRSVAMNIANRSEFTLNGGTLELKGLGNFGTTSLDNYLSGLDSLYVDQGGAFVDTLGNSVTITQAIQHVDSTTGGLTKRGVGTLTLSGVCGIVGTTTVEAGTLRIGAATETTGLSVSNNATLSLRNGTFDTLTVNAAALTDGARLDMDVDTASDLSDCIALPSGASVGKLVIGLYNLGTATPVTRPGTYSILSYEGTAPDVSGWTLASDMFGVSGAFVVNTTAQTIEAHIAYSSTQVAWANAGSGNWSESANWWPQAPAASGAVPRFGNALTAAATVAVDGAVSVAGLVFDHTYAYTLSGSTITLDNGATNATVAVARGSHVVTAPLSLNCNTVVSVSSNTVLTVANVVSGAGQLFVEGNGQLVLSGTNATPTTVRGGATVAVPDTKSLSAGVLTLDNGTLSVAASDTLSGSVALGAGGGRLCGGTGQTLQLGATVAGAGGLTKAGAGMLTLSALSEGYSGATMSDGGTLSLSDWPAGALILGRGTLAFTGASGSFAQPVTIASGTNAALLRLDSDLTLSGPITAVSGALIKSGAGSLTIAGANGNGIGLANAVNMGGVTTAGVDGDGPINGYGAFNVAQGRVTLGAAGQTNTIAGALLVGLNTTAAADAETAAELVLVSGLTTCSNWVYIGRNNGTTTTAPGGRASRLTLQDGELHTLNLSLGGASGFSGYTGRPVLEIQGGTCTVDDLFYVGETAGGVSTVWVNGGTLRHLVSLSNTSFRLGNTGGEGILRISSGSAEFAKDIVLACSAGCTGTVELAGGTLTAQSIYKLNGSGYGRITFNGGVFRPMGGSMSGLNVSQIGTGPAVFDTSLVSIFTLSQILTTANTTDGGLIKLGTNTLVVNAAMAYNGPTVVSGGVMRVQSALPAASALTVAPGARLTLNNATAKAVTVSGLTLGSATDTAPAELEFGVDSANATNDQLVVNGNVTAYHAAFWLYWQSSEADNIIANNKYALIRFTGTGPSSPDAFSVANQQAGKQYIFTLEGGVLWLQIGAATSDAYVWTDVGGGDWSESAKWVSAPGAGAVGASVRFDASIASASSVRLNQNTTLGTLLFNSTNSYAVGTDGASVMTVDNGPNAATVQVEQGRHVIAAPIALQNETDVKPISGTALTLTGPVSGPGGIVKLNGGELVLSGANSFTGGVRLTSGTVTLTNGATAGTGTLAFESDGSPVRVSGTVPSVCPGSVALRTPQALVTVDAQAKLTLSGELTFALGANVTNTLVKQGAGELALAGTASAAADNARVSLQEGTLRFASGSNCRIGGVARDVIKMDTDNSRARTLAVDAGAKTTLSGIFMASGTNAVVVDGQLDFSGNFDAASLRVQGTTAEDRFTVRSGGTVTCPQATWFNVGVRGPGVVVIDGGTAQLGCVSFGYQQRPLDYYGGAYGYAIVKNGGLLNVTGKWNWMGDSNNLSRVNMLQVGDGSSVGSTVRLPPTTLTTTNGWSTFGLDKGTLVTTGGGLTTPVAGDYLNGLKQLYVSANGGTFDTAGQDVTVSQSIGSDGAGGTLAKAGAGNLTLAQPLSWGGTVDVRGGTLNAALQKTTVCQTAPTNLLARYSFENGPVADSSGNGRHGVAQGIVTVSDGTNGLKGLTFATGQSSVCVPCDATMRGMSNFTVAAWVWLNAINVAANTPTTFFTTRKDNGSNGPYEFMIRMNNDKVRFMTMGATSNWQSYDSTLGVPAANQWVHIACAVTPSGVTMYINGILARSAQGSDLKTILFCPPDRPLNLSGFGFGHYHLAAPLAGQFTGRLDDIRVYSRVLSQAEVQALISTAPVLPSLRVAGGAVFVPQGGTNTVQDLSGEGAVSGALTVCGSVAPGDSTNTAAGASLAVDTLTFATNSVYKWTWSPTASDTLWVGRLKIDGAGVLDFGRTESDPVTGPFREVLMRYDAIEGAANFANWTFANVGRRGFVATITAENDEVVLNFLSVRGTVMNLR